MSGESLKLGFVIARAGWRMTCKGGEELGLWGQVLTYSFVASSLLETALLTVV